MCAILGSINVNIENNQFLSFEFMNHRGPDNEGFFMI